MRYLFVQSKGITDTLTGEVFSHLSLDRLLVNNDGGVIAGNNLYPITAALAGDIVRDKGWTMRPAAQKKRQPRERVGGVLYNYLLHYRHKMTSQWEPVEPWLAEYAGQMQRSPRYRPGSIRWVILNLELFGEVADEDIPDATMSLVSIAEARGIKLRHSPGSFGGALLRKSPEWESGRHAAPRFISKIGRDHLPGNFYEQRFDFRPRLGEDARKPPEIPHAYYLDQKSSHHTIASEIDLPHPQHIHARHDRKYKKDNYTLWKHGDNNFSRHVGLLGIMVECTTLPRETEHLYPRWCREPGVHFRWVYTPDMRLLDNRVKLLGIVCAYTSVHHDPVLREFGKWALDRIEEGVHPVVKSALLAPYGVLAVDSESDIECYSVHGRNKPERAEVCRWPLMDTVYRSTIQRRRTPIIQNVIARGVIESETRTRSIEYARALEAQGHRVVQIYADGLLVSSPQLPLLPPGWRVAGELTRVASSYPNRIISRELVRLPGIPGGRRTSVIRSSRDPHSARSVI